jgi:hypothetical protein
VGEICYLCGKTGPDTREHVVPKACYVPPLPEGLITLPAHLVCNQSTSMDEEWVSIGWSTCRPFPDDGDARYEKAMRALLRVQAEGLRRNYLDSMTSHVSGGAVLNLGNARVEYVLAKIVKGLLYHQDGLLISQDHTWSFKKIDLGLMVEQPFTRQIDVHNVVVFRWEALPNSIEPTIFWTLAVYNMHIFWGAAVAPGDIDRLVARIPSLKDGVRLAWPKAK